MIVKKFVLGTKGGFEFLQVVRLSPALFFFFVFFKSLVCALFFLSFPLPLLIGAIATQPQRSVDQWSSLFVHVSGAGMD